MRKWMWWTGLVAILTVVALVIFIGTHLGPIIEAAINQVGTRITDTLVRVEDVDVSMSSRQVDLQRLVIGNPQGFKASTAVEVDTISVGVEKGTLREQTVVIDHVTILSPNITYERTADTDNFQVILQSVRRATDAGKNKPPGQPAPTPSEDGKKLLIRNLVVQKGKVALYLPGDQTVTADLPEIHLRDIGGDGGVEPARVVEVILAALYQAIQSPDVLRSLAAQVEKLNIRIDGMDARAYAEKLQQGAGDMVDRLKGLLDRR